MGLRDFRLAMPPLYYFSEINRIIFPFARRKPVPADNIIAALLQVRIPALGIERVLSAPWGAAPLFPSRSPLS